MFVVGVVLNVGYVTSDLFVIAVIVSSMSPMSNKISDTE